MASIHASRPRPLALMLLICVPLATSTSASAEEPSQLAQDAVSAYAEHVHQTYARTASAAVSLQKAIDAFVAAPDEAKLKAARAAWIAARIPYGHTEAFRFYEGPIDAPASGTRPEGPEGRLNAWPLNEAYIDTVVGGPKKGIINDPQIPITREALVARNATDDEANVSLGWHAIEFLLWGQDLAKDGPGARPAADFVGQSQVPARRRAYLKLATEIVVADLNGLVADWAPKAKNYRAQFEALPPATALGHILTGLATLSGFELASERIAVPLDSRSQEDEHSCFSDTTHNDFAANAEGIALVYFGANGNSNGALGRWVKTGDAVLEAQLAAAIRKSVDLARKSPAPVDQALLAPDSDPRRKHLQQLVKALQDQAKLFQQTGKTMRVAVQITAE